MALFGSTDSCRKCGHWRVEHMLGGRCLALGCDCKQFLPPMKRLQHWLGFILGRQ